VSVPYGSVTFAKPHMAAADAVRYGLEGLIIIITWQQQE
jgi:hypothetical protein